MDWVTELPNFPSEDWIEIRSGDLFFDIADKKLKICRLGTASQNLAMGTVIFYKNRNNNKFTLAEYRNLKAKTPFLLRWGYENMEGLEGIAIYQENKWLVKKLDEYLKWEIEFNNENELISFTPFFIKQRQPGLN